MFFLLIFLLTMFPLLFLLFLSYFKKQNSGEHIQMWGRLGCIYWCLWKKVTMIISRMHCITPHSGGLSGAASCRGWCLVLGYIQSRKSSVLVSPWLRAPGTVLLSLSRGQMAEYPAKVHRLVTRPFTPNRAVNYFRALLSTIFNAACIDTLGHKQNGQQLSAKFPNAFSWMKILKAPPFKKIIEFCSCGFHGPVVVSCFQARGQVLELMFTKIHDTHMGSLSLN